MNHECHQFNSLNFTVNPLNVDFFMKYVFQWANLGISIGGFLPNL